MMEEMHCPFCGKGVRSDATVKRVCALCGMGIAPEATVFAIEDSNQYLTFCSVDCLVAHRFVDTSKG